MPLDFAPLEAMRAHHPAWRLLRSDHASLVASFLHRAFVQPNVRHMPAATLAEALDDELYALRQQLGDDAFPRAAMEYLNDWAAPDKGWLRKFYLPGTDEAHFDLTPATEKAIAWLLQLSQRQFIGTESRLLTLFELLKQMSEGAEADPAVRVAELRKRRDEIDADIARALAGTLPLLDDTALKERFQQFTQMARDLLSDFREVEHNFRQLDRSVRERIALWDGAKGALLQQILGERDAIAESDQGRSFRAFWDFLMSSQRQEELSTLLDRVLALPPVANLQPEARMRRVHYDWLEAGEHTQRTVAQLSQQLRRFLDDQAWLENRRIMDLLRSIETRAVGLRSHGHTASLPTPMMTIDEPAARIDLAMERPLYAPAHKPSLAGVVPVDADEAPDDASLYQQVRVDKARLARHIRQALQQATQVTLRELVATQPLRQGLAELVAYLQLGDETFRVAVDESHTEAIPWNSVDAAGQPTQRVARLPRVIYVR
ncbi:DUF3375 domain-containing protein [Ramlibacter sp.]|uniref:DUF3375 domain-containing protein n=1 Tax=Ramlibacter sp. TaxID=1917967 RepID=UPI0035AFD972